MNRRFIVICLLASFLIAGVGSYYASTHPDGLEYVAEQTGFIESAEDSPTADSPLADYQASGIDNERVSGGVTGVAGVVLVLLIAGGITWMIRRRGVSDSSRRE